MDRLERGVASSSSTRKRMEPETATAATSARRWPWVYVTVILCLYGFFKEFKPSEPFLTPYLVDTKNFTKAEVNSEIYPYWPYSYLVAAMFVFLFTDLLRYKPVILVEAFSYLSTRILLIWGTTVFSMQWMQVAYGVATASEIAYYSYIYTAVASVHYKTVTSFLRAIRLFGESLSSVVAQIVTSTGALSLLQLNYISLGSVSLACLFALILPNPCTCACEPSWGKGILSIDSVHPTQKPKKENFFIKAGRDLNKFYSNLSLLKWSIWWALATCGVFQVGNYVQSLWKQIAEDAGDSHEFNGLVEALATFFSALAALLLSLLKVNWAVWGEVVIGLFSLVDSIMLLIASATQTVWVAYICHILYRTTYSFLITIASVQLAHAVDHDSYGLIFGFNTFIALLLMTGLTFVVADEHGLDLDIRKQFVVYSGYYYVLTLVFIGAGIYKLTSTGWLKSIRVCCREQTLAPTPHDQPHSTGEGPSEQQPMIQNDSDSESSQESSDKLV